MIACNICRNTSLSSVYESPDDLSITTMGKLISGKTRVYLCDECGHLQTNELPNIYEYYAQEYEINLTSDEEDQLYKVEEGKSIYRADHQAEILMSKIKFQGGCRVLDYGCAKSPTLKKLIINQPDIEPFLFDVTDKYISFWERFPKPVQWSIKQPKLAWYGTMDVVLSFYALEHVANLHDAIRNIKLLLKPGGIFYFLVPNVYHNIADFVVADHINHFSESSLQSLLQMEGFVNIEVDEKSHVAAFVVRAILAPTDSNNGNKVANIAVNHQVVFDMADYWKSIVGKIREFELHIDNGTASVYGAGFYGNFIMSVLRNPDRINCVIDQNEHLLGREVRGKRIVPPDALPAQVTHVLVGMNPNNARTNINAITSWQNRKLIYFFL
jgi:SAM-dependent methyltransferase